MSRTIHYRTCNLCEALCGLEIEVENNRAVAIRGDKKDVFSKGHICPKAVALKDIHEDPDRLKFPLKKTDDGWKEISWAEAIEYTAKKLSEIQTKYGVQAIGVYQGNPSVHNLGTSLYSPHFVRLLKTKNRFSATSVDQLAHHLAGEFMFGHANLIPIPDIERTDFWLILGGNPIVSNGSIMTAPDVRGKIRSIQSRGGKVVVIDPRRTETADKSDQHLFIQPGTDVFLLLGMVRHFVDDKRRQLGHLSDLIDASQIRSIKELVQPYRSDYVSQATGISQDSIEQLYKDFESADRAVCYGRLGVSACEYGGLSHWAINVVNILSGNFDREGGAMFTTPAINMVTSRDRGPKFNRWQSRVRGLPEFAGELPSSTLADEILTPGEGQIKAMVTSCGNPVLSVPNGTRLDQAFEQLDFMVSIDIYLNETTRHASIILPPATGLETPHFGTAFYNFAVRNHVKFSPATLEKEPGTKFDWEIFRDLHKAYAASTLTEEQRSQYEFLYEMNPESMLDMGLAGGKSGVSLPALKTSPHGKDLGPLIPQLPGKINHASKKIDLLPSIYRKSFNTLKPSEINGGFKLIGRRQLRSNNSWFHNVERMVKGPKRCTLLLNPLDASNLSIEDSEIVRVTSSVGSVKIPVEISDEIMQGTVSIPHGWGHHRKGLKMSVATQHAGVSLNDLIDDQHVDQMCGVSVINGIQVEIFKIPNESLSLN